MGLSGTELKAQANHSEKFLQHNAVNTCVNGVWQLSFKLVLALCEIEDKDIVVGVVIVLRGQNVWLKAFSLTKTVSLIFLYLLFCFNFFSFLSKPESNLFRLSQKLFFTTLTKRKKS